MTTRANLYVDQGVDFLISLELETEEGEEFSISGQSFFCQVRKLYSSAITFEAELEVIVNDDTNKLNLFISPEKTKDIKDGKYQYDLIMRNNSSGQIKKILEGLIFVLPTITRIES